MDTLTGNTLNFTDFQKNKPVFVEWQTWEFEKVRPGFLYASGICEKDEFIEVLAPALHTIGFVTWWREVKLGTL